MLRARGVAPCLLTPPAKPPAVASTTASSQAQSPQGAGVQEPVLPLSNRNTILIHRQATFSAPQPPQHLRGSASRFCSSAAFRELQRRRSMSPAPPARSRTAPLSAPPAPLVGWPRVLHPTGHLVAPPTSDHEPRRKPLTTSLSGQRFARAFCPPAPH
jgi:hypothetical protein